MTIPAPLEDIPYRWVRNALQFVRTLGGGAKAEGSDLSKSGLRLKAPHQWCVTEGKTGNYERESHQATRSVETGGDRSLPKDPHIQRHSNGSSYLSISLITTRLGLL